MNNKLILEFYEIATQLAPSICAQLKYTGDRCDLVHDYILNVITNQYYKRYDKNLGGIRRYIYVSLKNLILNKFRVTKGLLFLDVDSVADLSNQAPKKNTYSGRDSVHHTDVTYAKSGATPQSTYRFDKFIKKYEDSKFKNKSLSRRDVLKLLGEGFSVSSIARYGGLSPTAISKAILKIRGDLGGCRGKLSGLWD